VNGTGPVDPGAMCPYGVNLGFGVSLPKDTTLVQWVALFYSFMPYFLIAGFVIKCAWRDWPTLFKRANCKDWAFLSGVGILWVLNELILKRILKGLRPGQRGKVINGIFTYPSQGSCQKTHGSPSAHSSITAFMLLEFWKELFIQAYQYGHFQINNFKNLLKDLKEWKGLPRDVLTAVFFAILLVPVHWSRVELKDHTKKQVWQGIGLGVSFFILWNALIQFIFPCPSPLVASAYRSLTPSPSIPEPSLA